MNGKLTSGCQPPSNAATPARVMQGIPLTRWRASTAHPPVLRYSGPAEVNRPAVELCCRVYLQSPVAGFTDVMRKVCMPLALEAPELLAPAPAPAPAPASAPGLDVAPPAPVALLPARPDTVPVTSTRLPTYCCRFSPPDKRYLLADDAAPLVPAVPAAAPADELPPALTSVRMNPALLPCELALVEAPPAALPAPELPLPASIQPVRVIVRSLDGWSPAPVRGLCDCPLCPCGDVAGVCAETPIASATLSIVPKSIWRFIQQPPQ